MIVLVCILHKSWSKNLDRSHSENYQGKRLTKIAMEKLLDTSHQ